VGERGRWRRRTTDRSALPTLNFGASSDRLLRLRLRDGFFVTLHHLEPTRFGEWAIRRADGTIADLLHKLDDDIVIVTVVLLRLQRRESERAACLEFIRANWHERSGDGGLGQRFCVATGYPAAPRKPDDREGDCSACRASASGFHRTSHPFRDFHDFSP
jgi:hypothetical protein